MGIERNDKSRTVLIAEPDTTVRSLVRRVLADEGHLVLEAGNGVRAIQLAAKHRGPIDLLITGSWLPGPYGRELCELVARMHPETKVLFVSRSLDEELTGEVLFLRKPYSLQDLLHGVWEVLDGRRFRAAAGRVPQVPARKCRLAQVRSNRNA